ncbi:MAG: hypothetical protein PVG66_13920 [Chromatiales bacterium]|jgi:hypothetical protein
MSNEDCVLREGVDLNVADVRTIAQSLKSLAAYSMLAYEHDDDPEELQALVDEGLQAIDRIFEC